MPPDIAHQAVQERDGIHNDMFGLRNLLRIKKYDD
jgi:hypothetical protein